MKAIYFTSANQFRAWLEKNAAKESELLVGFHKRHTSKPTMTWQESVLEALCFGWIDAVRRSVDADRYTIRFTRRKPTSIWSAINIRHVERLEKEGRMTDAGRKAFAARSAKKSTVYAYEQKQAGLAPTYEKQLRAHAKAWAFFSSQAPWYQRNAGYWVSSAKKEETRAKRLAELIERSEQGLWLRQYIARKSK